MCGPATVFGSKVYALGASYNRSDEQSLKLLELDPGQFMV